jgi:hypothetical protein
MLSVDADPEVGAVDSDPLDKATATPERCVLGRLQKTSIGVRGAGGSARVRRGEAPGCFLYGPYWQLPAGVYRLNFRCRCGKPRMPSQPVLGVEVIAMNRVQLAWLDLTAAELLGQTGPLDFLVPPSLGLGAGDEARLEFRFFHLGNADLTIAAVGLLALQITKLPEAPARLWRMLGRLKTTTISKRGEEAVTVRQSAPAGCMLASGQPFLQLPQGRYRLSFHCRAGMPGMAAAPVLGVEVVARWRWQDGSSESWNWRWPLGRPTRGVQIAWRDFTERQLRSGLGSIDFTVPPELGLEGGQDVVFGLHFVHLGNAALAIGAAELRRFETEAAPPHPREWRLFGRLVKGRIGTRDASGVTVRQGEPAGCLLSGCRPTLQLPRGRFRLSFCCRAGGPRDPAQPVLEVQVVARSRSRSISPSTAPRSSRGRSTAAWRRLLPRGGSAVLAHHCFTVAALAGDRASVDFEVPPELSRERHEGVSFEFRFLHLGNAALTISAVNLNENSISEEGRPLPVPSFVSSEKTTILIVGNCQAQTLYEALTRASKFNSRLDVKYHFVGLQQNLHDLGKGELKQSNVLLVQDIRDWYNYPLRPYVPDDMRIIKFPLLHFASLWPFDHYNGPGDKEAYEREWPNLTFLYHDGLLARLRKEIPDREQRLLAYRALSVDGLINFSKLHDFEKRRLTAMDKQFGCGIGQFILKNFQRRRLFYTTNHPNGLIIAMLMQYLLGQLGIDGLFRPNANLDHLKRLQVPVHPKVAKALGVKWADESTKYLYDGEHITWETYVRRYIDHYG